jgi:hypothetical protein
MDTRDRTTQAILAAYRQLPSAERQQIDRLTKALDEGLTRRNHKLKGFGKQSAIELIGKVGVLLARHLEPR